MLDTARLIRSYEECERKGFLAQRWEKNKMPPNTVLDDGIRTGLEHSGKDFGEESGSRVFELAATRGLDSKEYDQHSEAVHLANLADIITTATRKSGDKSWIKPEENNEWIPSCFISHDGNYLRRVVTLNTWSEERQNSLCRSWETLGPIAFYNLPMQIAVAVIGNHRNGKWHSFWAHALQHPQNKKLRFRKKNDIATGFKSSWLECWRPDHDEINTKDWLDAMIGDDVLRDVFFKVDMPRMEEISRERVMEVARRKMERIRNTKTLPDENYSGCSWPVKCQFLSVCNRGEIPNGRYGFIPVSSVE